MNLKTSLLVANTLLLLFCFWCFESSWAQDGASNGNLKDEQLLFNCHLPINPYDPNFQQGDEKFLKIFYYPKEKLISFDLSDMSGNLSDISKKQRWPFLLDEGLSTLSSRFPKGYLSMVYLGNANWGAFLKNCDQEDEFLCREILNVESV
jgi:hypothetical protein